MKTKQELLSYVNDLVAQANSHVKERASVSEETKTKWREENVQEGLEIKLAIESLME